MNDERTDKTVDEQAPEQTSEADIEHLEEDVERLEHITFTESTVGTREDMQALWRWVVYGVALILSLFHLYTATFGTLPSLQQRSFHLGVGLGLIFLLYPAKSEMAAKEARRGWVLTALGFVALGWLAATDVAEWYTVLPAAVVLVLIQTARHLPWRLAGMPVADLLLSLGGIGVGMYIFVFEDAIQRRVAAYSEVDLAVATVGVLLVLLATQRVIGTPLVVVASVMLVYAYFGPQMPGFLRHGGYSLDRIMATSFLGTEAVFGTPIRISAIFIFLFMIFAAMLQHTGMERFFTRLAFGLTGGMTGGPAKVGVLTSAFSGTITGSSVANTVGNGAFTIPMMKRAGYKPEFAGAVEAASSTGGQFAPPIMGAAAFIMIEFTATPYVEIIKAAIIPAILFFTAQFVVIHYESKRQGVMGLPRSKLPNVRRLMLTQGYLLVPVVVIFVILAMGFSPQRAALMAIFAAVVVNFLVQLVALPFGKWRDLEDKLNIRKTADALVDAARIALPIITACAAAGLIAGVITLTGLGLKLAGALVALAGETLILTMVFAMIASLVLGIGLPTTANYVITATMAAPALLFFDPVPVLAAHFFVYYFGVMADITPPVCLASYAASGIARSNPLMTGVHSVRIALGGFLVPYMFVFAPELLLIDATWFTGTKAVITALVGAYCVGTAVVGHIDRKINVPLRLLLAGAGLLLLYGEIVTDGIGFSIFVVTFAYQWWSGRARRKAEASM
jgi:TRAP transporter 4TM/12TM fusion protein